jgi:arabinofuranosyltransferase
VLFAGAFLCIFTLFQSHNINHGFGFPLDDPWIHLQFARNLHDYGAFSYYKDQMITSGSTSPLYTFILAAGFFITNNEMILSYTIGIAFLLLAAFMAFRLAYILFEHDIIFSLSAAFLVIINHRLQWIAISGMETTLFISLLLMVLFFYYTRKYLQLGIVSGLLLWARPEAIILYAVLAVDIFFNLKIVKQPKVKKHRNIPHRVDLSWIKKAVPYTIVIITVYAAFNLILSGSIFPNTYSAKMKYYSGPGQDFPGQVFSFLIDGNMYLFAILALVSIVRIIWNVVRRKQNRFLILLLWSIFLFVAYWHDLPKLYQNGRYLMPIIPIYIIFVLDGLKIFISWLKERIHFLTKPNVAEAMAVLVILIFVFQAGEKSLASETSYIKDCRYITDRQVKTALWIRDNIPENAVVATHDIGAIGFYSNRQIVDMVGLVSPEMIKNIGRFDLLKEFLVKSKVTHIAVLKNWFEIVNENPLMQTDPTSPEVMQVFRFDPERTHFTSQEATRLNDAGEYYLSAGNAAYAFQIFRQSLGLDPQSARTNFLIGKAALLLRDTALAWQRFNIVGRLQPDYPGLSDEVSNLRIKRH